MALYVDTAEAILYQVADQTGLKKNEHLDIAVVLCDDKGNPVKYRPECNGEEFTLPGFDTCGGWGAPTPFFVRNLGARLERMTRGNEIVFFRCLPGDDREVANSYGGYYTLCLLYLRDRSRGDLDGFFTLEELCEKDNVGKRVVSAFKLARDIAPHFNLGRKFKG